MIERGFMAAALVILLLMLLGMAGFFVIQGFSASSPALESLPISQPVASTPILLETPLPSSLIISEPPPFTEPAKEDLLFPTPTAPQPLPSAVTASPMSGIAPLMVNFSIPASATTEYSNSGIYYTIVFGDGEAGAFPRIPPFVTSHTYASAGTYTATITERTQCSSWECLGPSREVGTVTVTAK